MKVIESDIIILGGGLTGLTLAYLLRNRGLKVLIVEARNKLGGRIQTSKQENAAPIEMGATWLGKKHTYLNKLLKELGVNIFEQRLGKTAIYEPFSTSPPQLVSLPPNSDPSFRIQGSTSNLINLLSDSLPEEQVFLSNVVKSIRSDGEILAIETLENRFLAKQVVSTIPPYLLLKSIDIQPGLPAELIDVMKKTHTWMGESIKVGLRFEHPFWREEGLSGTIFSNVGPITEFYDHSDYEDNHYALKGFLNSGYHQLKKEERLEVVLTQLRKYYGKKVDEYIDYEEVVWSKERFTFTKYNSHVLAHQNNGHVLYQKTYLNGKLFIAGAETASSFGGYMEGAVRSAYFVSENL